MSKTRVAIDPGHGFSNVRPGQYDSGALGNGRAESEIALIVGNSLAYVFRQSGISYWFSRDDETDPDPVSTRDDRAEKAGCTHFIALHLNCADAPSATGTETFYRDSVDKAWAGAVQNAALSAFGLRDRGLKTEGESQHSRLAVFDFDGACCLVELGFISNKADLARLLDREKRIAFAQAIANQLMGKK